MSSPSDHQLSGYLALGRQITLPRLTALPPGVLSLSSEHFPLRLVTHLVREIAVSAAAHENQRCGRIARIRLPSLSVDPMKEYGLDAAGHSLSTDDPRAELEALFIWHIRCG